MIREVHSRSNPAGNCVRQNIFCEQAAFTGKGIA
jgi:hypothetical protein